VRSSVFAFNFQYPLVSLRSSSSCLPLLPCHPITTLPRSIFPPIRCFRRQSLRKMWPIQLAFLLFIVYKMLFSSFVLCNTLSFPARLVRLASPCFSSTIFQNFPDSSDLFFEVSQGSPPYKALFQMQNSTSSTAWSTLRESTVAGLQLVLRVTGTHDSFHHEEARVNFEGCRILHLLKNYFQFPCMYCSYFVPFETVAKFTPEVFSF
jgi:hypothetical protein